MYRILIALILSWISVAGFAQAPTTAQNIPHQSGPPTKQVINNRPLVQLPLPAPLKFATSASSAASTAPAIRNNNLPAKTAAPVTNTAAMAPTAKVNLNNLQAQLNSTQEDLKTYKRQVSTQFNQIEQQNQTLQTEITHVQQMLTGITQQMTVITEKLALNSSAALSQSAISIDNSSQHLTDISPKEKLSTIIFAIAIILIAILWWPWSKGTIIARQRKEPVINNSTDNDEEEYDFMNSREAIPAKLDLARAYIDMSDYESAKRALQEVITLGNPVERKQAKLILSKMVA